jgi:hypothetical protein
MATKKRISKWVWIFIVTGLVMQLLFDPLSSLQNFSASIEAQIGIPMAHARWEAQHITHYSFDVRAFNQVCLSAARVEVRNEKVVQVNLKDYFEETEDVSKKPLPRGEWASPYYLDIFACNYANFTIPQIFDMAGEHLRSINRISFDAKYGFISEARFGSFGGKGLLSPKLGGAARSWRSRISRFWKSNVECANRSREWLVIRLGERKALVTVESLRFLLIEKLFAQLADPLQLVLVEGDPVFLDHAP